jgi:DNA-directed RNA polymerase specialized sigma24 family protein
MRPRDRQVVLAVAVGGLSKKQVGQELGIGKERARQLYERGIREARRGARLAAADVA